MSENCKTVYSYKLYHSDSDNSKVQKIDLPDNITSSDFINIVRQKNLSNAGKIQLIKTTNNIQKNITLFIDDNVKTAGEVQDILRKKYGSVCGFTPKSLQSAPTVITGHLIRHRYGMSGGYNVHIDRNTTVFKEPKEITWDEPNAVVETPKSETDVIVNRELKQIWPVATNTFPQVIQDFFVNER